MLNILLKLDSNAAIGFAVQENVKPRKNTAEKWYEKLEGVIR